MPIRAGGSHLIYLDHNATTPVAKEVVEALVPCLETNFGNPSSSHELGRRAKAALDAARAQVGSLVGAPASSILFLSGGTESINYVLKGLVSSKPHQRHIVTSVVEHVAVLATCRFLEEAHGFEVTYVPVDAEGLVSVAAVAAAVRASTCLVTIMHANNEVGSIQPLAAISAAVRAQHSALCTTGDNGHLQYDPILIHSDASQSVGKFPVLVDVLGVDFLTIAGHKVYAPKGVGALYIRPGTRALVKFMHGAAHEQNLRAGTENIPFAVALGTACELAQHSLATGLSQSLLSLRRQLLTSLTSLLATVPVKVNGPADVTKLLPNTLSISFQGVSANELLHMIEDRVAASAGSACHSHATTVSHVLEAMQVPVEFALGTLRLTVGKDTTPEDVECAAVVIAQGVQTLRQR
ncbi:hypothetical protein H257_13986 [Aphanomyces astaci]|uniref:cysteine desulfurase n=1 Tax=Aphanomyces astaci TaxID=112090 RepID=W4FVG3_APHAT|nr:hypothetical protein H257_13986 [Aphanomyces astaci]ETV70613.1 hypothetical protein H257_13986 [Aphanomyces astaci]|eukprot:XP_009839996.1 hypothetical protein H257_13986 [Aphanomyces astaci]